MTPASDIARMLGERIEPLVRDLLPGGLRDGRTWRCGSVAGEAGGSLSVELIGPKRGVWVDHANPDHCGDALTLVRFCLDAGTVGAIARSAGLLGIAPRGGRVPRPA